MSEEGIERSFDQMSRQQLLVYAKELHRLYEETRRLRAELARKGREAIGPDGRIGRYIVKEEIGRGGTAAVFRAYDPDLNRDVALKVLHSYYSEDSTFAARFRREAEATARLDHPNIVHVYDFGESGDFTYIVTNYIDGGTLEERMGRRFDFGSTLEYARPLAEALDYAHDHNVVHRDLKPSNVLLDSEQRPVLSDFGIARVLEESVDVTLTKWVVGTPGYMSPEQVLGEPVDRRSDLYSFGIIIYRLLLGRLPVREVSQAATLFAHVFQGVVPPRELDPGLDRRLEAVMLKALAKEPASRFQTVGEFVQALETVSDHPG